MNQITNKNKRNATGEWCQHPRSFLKRLGNKRLRKDSIEIEDIPKFFPGKKDTRFKQRKLCPFCLDDIHAQYLNSKLKRHGNCKKCGAKKNGSFSCSHCKSLNMWVREDLIMCKNCGKTSILKKKEVCI